MDSYKIVCLYESLKIVNNNIFYWKKLTLFVTALWVSSWHVLWIRCTLGHTFQPPVGKLPESERVLPYSQNAQWLCYYLEQNLGMMLYLEVGNSKHEIFDKIATLANNWYRWLWQINLENNHREHCGMTLCLDNLTRKKLCSPELRTESAPMIPSATSMLSRRISWGSGGLSS